MAQITVQGKLDGTTTKSVLNITELERSSTNTNFSLNFKTNFTSSSGFIGTGESLDGIVQISGNGMASQTKTITLKSSSESWSGTAVHSKNETFNVLIPANVTNVSIKYTLKHNPSNDNAVGTTSMSLTKLVSLLNPFENNAKLNLENSLTLSILKYDSNYTNNLVLYFRNNETLSQLASWNNVVDGQIIQLNESQLNNLYNLTTSNKFYALTWELITLDDSTNLGSMQLESAGLISNANPIFTDFDYEDSNSLTVSVTGNNQTIVKGASILKVKVPIAKKATAQKGASIVSYMIGDTQIAYSETNDVSVEIPRYNSDKIKVTVVDSRGNTTSIEKTFTNVIYYTSVSVEATSATIERTNDSEEQTKISFSGSFFNGNFGLENNELTINYKYRLAGSTGNYTAGVTTITPAITENSYNVIDKVILGDTDVGFDTSNSYEIIISIEDKLSVNEISYVLGPGIDAIVIQGNKVLKINNQEPKFYPGKNVITLTSNGGQSINANAYGIVSLTNEIKIGTKLTSNASNSRIIVGAGVTHVLTSFHIQGNTQGRAWVTLFHKSSSDSIKGRIDALGSSPSDYFAHWNCAPRVFEVEEGDYFFLQMYPQKATTLNQNVSNEEASYMTVEAID